MRNGYVLYRAFDGDGRLLYVGATVNPGSRLDKHAQRKPWWGDVAVIKLEHLGSAEELVAAETEAITNEGPKYNQIHSGKTPVWAFRPRGPMGEGSVFQRADGIWVGSCELPPVDGKRKQIRVYGPTREIAAEKLATRRTQRQS